ncbi:hypothetical protein HO173_005921 [Letharia columbiana]|uniref:Uncharacterized protein n=1 Tax=Letharia columbiana TaxID=112416 RepID=A0A8H6FVU9_9LECA|nr:uncharacterized protein HO173_005921 [Letharia columbiana]KAF6235726.1 hypothetical protein HO173_005921 [Letharia columbiana]
MLMSSTTSVSSQKPSMSLVKSIGYLTTAITKKLTGSDKVAPLFIAPHVENEEFEHVVELACGHILCKKDDDKARGARCGLLGSNSLFANLSIYEATRCPICESNLLANRNVGSERDFRVAALRVPEKHTTVAKSGELYGPER